MCGIAAYLQHEPLFAPQALEGVVSRMIAEMRYRGPDDSGTWADARLAMGNCRLSIIDLDRGKQPITNEDGTLVTVFNGEIYNYPQLRARLVKAGHTFKTQCDTEVLVHLYEDYGRDCVRHLRGMFAFAIWDSVRQRLLVARDRLGQKPIYYRQDSHGIRLASEIKALFIESGSSPEMNARAMHHNISLRCIPGADTMFAGVEKLPAAHTMLVERGQVDIAPYWDIDYTDKQMGSTREREQGLHDTLLGAVESHLLSDVPVGAFLSGGIDSSLLVAMMSSLGRARVPTFSIGVREQGFDETPYARLVAQHCGSEHHELVVEPNLVSTLPEMIWHMEEPVDPFAFGVYTVSKLASEHVKVVLGGDGGDEMFAGYDRYLGNRLVDFYCMVPGVVRRRLVEPLLRRLPDGFQYNNKVQRLRWMMEMSRHDGAERYAQSASYLRFGHEHKQSLYQDGLWRELGGMESTDHLVALFGTDRADQALDRMLYTDVKSRLPDHLLMIGDRMSMAHSLECRSPYVDHEVVQVAASLPAGDKIRRGQLKHIQRRIAARYLPAMITERPKKGFGFPLAQWFQHDLRPMMLSMMASSHLVEAGYFRRQAMLDLLWEHVEGTIDHNYRLWLLLNMELWYRLFVEGESVGELQGLLECWQTRVTVAA